ncbi:ATP-dependent zinc protease [Halomonas sp. M20]|uniref:ATP-dependent zinc protease family protein n=1 Tax=Halomonas sp. M20 TaxID=2763264 RepID=UPI0029CAAD34|nr:RimK/LysX family protein [Halomonas sp. M20]
MPIRNVMLAFTAGMLLLGGCALQPQSPDESRFDALVTTPQLDSRLSALEDSLAQRCESDADRLESHTARLDEVGESVNAMSGTLGSLRAEIKNLGDETSAPPADCPTSDIEALENKTLLGRTEWVGFPTIGTYLKARIDSGANTASISAKDITEFEREGENWVRFNLALDEDDTVIDSVRDKPIEAEITRRVRIVQASGEESRPVITLLMRLGPIKQNVDFTLNDRSHLDYPVLLGRRFMLDIALIDVSQSYLHERPEYPGGESADSAAQDEARDGKDDKE